MNRDQLQNDYIESIIDGMDHKSMYQFVYDTIEQNLETYSDEELVTEVKDYYPDLLKEDLDKEDDSWYTDPMSKASHHHY
jgi:hypothetical protein